MMKFRWVAVVVLVSFAGMAYGQIPQVGSMAPKFVAKDHMGKDVTFPPLGSWSVLAFYPRASSPG